MTIRVILGEDSYLVREGIRRVLEEQADIDIVANCADFDSLQTAVQELHPDVVLTDIRMPPTNTDEGISLAAELRTTHPDVGVVVLSQYAEAAYAARLFEAGSDRRGYLLKERISEPAELTRALNAVAGGGSIVDPRVVEHLLAPQQRGDSARLDTLTAREREILGLVAEGWSNAVIAERLQITKRAVERHIHAIFSKLDLGEPEVSGRVKATLLYLAAGAGQQ